ncbi:Hypothetical protein KVN_LOCUS145 [uncultured virus]|nr:Hypothetical protein KVN_LOCUS145 [uncultured virus]
MKYPKNSNLSTELIELSEESLNLNINVEKLPNLEKKIKESTNQIHKKISKKKINNKKNSEKKTNKNTLSDCYDIVLIQKENIVADDPKIMEFIKFSINNGIFDDTFYDYGNAFSVMATKLPILFEKLSDDGIKIKKNIFINYFSNKKGFYGDIKFIYNTIDKQQKGYISWEEITDFYLPFVKYVTF